MRFSFSVVDWCDCTRVLQPVILCHHFSSNRLSLNVFQATEENDAIARLKHMGCDPWRRLSHYHWPAILSLYNISLSGHYISILPPIRLSHAVSSEQARALRNPNEKAVQHFQWHALAAALDPLDFSGMMHLAKNKGHWGLHVTLHCLYLDWQWVLSARLNPNLFTFLLF